MIYRNIQIKIDKSEMWGTWYVINWGGVPDSNAGEECYKTLEEAKAAIDLWYSI